MTRGDASYVSGGPWFFRPDVGRSRTSPLDRSSVLIVDRESTARQVVVRTISSDPALALVGCASDSEEAVELVRRHRPDIALVEVDIPKGGGIRATREMLVHNPSTRVVALSARSDRGAVTKMLGAGAVGYLVKGSSADVLQAIHATARGEGVLSHEIAGQVLGALSERLVGEERAEWTMQLRAAEIQAAIQHELFAIALQPVFDLRTGKVLGVEALARFDPDNGRDPRSWFSEAWGLGLGLDLELSILSKALAVGAKRPEGLFLSINVTPLTVTSDRLARLLEQADMPSHLVVEITEQTRVENHPLLNERLGRLRNCGVRLAVDDAGSGYASLRHIVQLQPDFIKLDMSSVSDIEDNDAQQAMVSSLVHFGEETGCTIVAEGIEHPGQLASLTSLGVTVGQGYLLATPQLVGVGGPSPYDPLGTSR